MNDPRDLVEHFFRHEYGRLVAVLDPVLRRARSNWSRTSCRPLARAGPGDVGVARRARRPGRVALPYRPPISRSTPFVGNEPTPGRCRTLRTVPGVRRHRPTRISLTRSATSRSASPVRLCCHEAVPDRSTRRLRGLRTLCGFSTPEIARSLLTTEANVQKRIERAPGSAARLDVDFRTAAPHLRARLDTVLSVIYLLFSQGCHATHTDVPIRRATCATRPGGWQVCWPASPSATFRRYTPCSP